MHLGRCSIPGASCPLKRGRDQRIVESRHSTNRPASRSLLLLLGPALHPVHRLGHRTRVPGGDIQPLQVERHGPHGRHSAGLQNYMQLHPGPRLPQGAVAQLAHRGRFAAHRASAGDGARADHREERFKLVRVLSHLLLSCPTSCPRSSPECSGSSSTIPSTAWWGRSGPSSSPVGARPLP